MFRILMTGGGTAGHVNPALAIAQTVKEQDPDAVIEFVGTKRGKERDLVPAAGYRLHYLEAQGFERTLNPARIPSNLKSAYLALTSPGSEDTQRLLREFKPDLVIGTGGYACWPLVRGAQKLGIPTMLHESNAKPGLAVKILSRRADCTLVNFKKTIDALPKGKNVIHVGNPLREGFGNISKEEAKRRLGLDLRDFFILSFGGSLGAEEVNRSMVHTMEQFSSKTPHVTHLHGCGSRDYTATKALYDKAFPGGSSCCRLVEYIHEMPLWMSAADLVICRAGAMTVSEIALLCKTAILIPSPYVAADHQYENARTLYEAHAAALYREKKDQTAEESFRMAQVLTQTVSDLYEDPATRTMMEQNITAFAEPHANRLVWQEIAKLCGDKTKMRENEKVRIPQ